MKTSDFDYFLPVELIAQTPIEPRDQARLMVLDRASHSLKHHRFWELADYLRSGDVLVFNNTRVIPARLSGRMVGSEGRVEVLLLRQLSENVWETLARPAKRLKIGTRIEITSDTGTGERQDFSVMAETVGLGEGGIRVMTFSDGRLLSELGRIALPPYIHVPLENPERYQTVYARVLGSVAAPTAGLHFTDELIDRARGKGARCLFVTLHVGLDTFQPVREEDPLKHPIHQEYGVVSQEVAHELCQAKREGRRVFGVGTTSVRLLEAAAQASCPTEIKSFAGWVNLFIVPGYQFQMVDAMLTNFHLPRSTTLMLASAYAGKDFILEAYKEAIARQYRFYSFGDAMLIG